jgi:hypothetical protein
VEGEAMAAVSGAAPLGGRIDWTGSVPALAPPAVQDHVDFGTAGKQATKNGYRMGPLPRDHHGRHLADLMA